MKEIDLTHWLGVPHPNRNVVSGRYVRLEPLHPSHIDDLYAAVSGPEQEQLFRYMFQAAPASHEEFASWADQCISAPETLYYAVVDQDSGQAEGWQALMRIDTKNGSIELGNVMRGPLLAKTRGATEAFFLSASTVFDLGYRRLEWKCDAQNLPSQRAAERFGFTFEGTFRNHMVVKGRNRDTSWFSITDSQWNVMRPEFIRWLAPDNFDSTGRQLTKLRFGSYG